MTNNPSFWSSRWWLTHGIDCWWKLLQRNGPIFTCPPNFNTAMLTFMKMDPADIDPPKQSTCTSCIYKEDTSNYWTASIYFKSPENGTFKRVPQMANGRMNGTLLEQEGGLTIYYMRPFRGSSKKTTAMKPVRTISKPRTAAMLTSI